MATIVRTDEDFAKMYVFRTQDDHILQIEDFKDGVAKVYVTPDHTIESLARMISGCFSRKSNFASQILEAYHCDKDAEFKGFAIDINGKLVNVTEENSDIDDVLESLRQAVTETKEQVKLDIFGDFLEGLLGIPKELTVLQHTIQIEFKDKPSEKAWKEWINSAQNQEAEKIAIYGDSLARYAQKAMKEGYPFNIAIARADVKITSFYESLDDAEKQYAIDKLINCWKYGEELKKWNDSRTKLDLENMIDEI